MIDVDQNYGVSLTDLLEHPEFKDLNRDPLHPKFNDERSLRKALWDFGLDTSKAIQVKELTHRNLRNKVITCAVWRGLERNDKAWLDSGCASLEALKSSTGDKSLRKELDLLSRQ